MTQSDLILDIQNELTFAKALPYSIPEQEIIRIITIAERYFYDNWRHAIEPRYLLIPLEIFKNPQKEKEIKKFCNMVAKTRETMGLHFESDTNFGKIIATALSKHPKIKEIYFKK